MVRHPRIEDHVRRRAQDLGPTTLRYEATLLREAKHMLLQYWRPGTILSELQSLALEGIGDSVRIAADELTALDLLVADGETLRPALFLLHWACFLFARERKQTLAAQLLEEEIQD